MINRIKGRIGIGLSKKYIQLYSKITDAVKAGDYVAGDKLPTELELAETYHVSRQTVRQALEKLEKEGFIFKVQGSGSYISEAVKQFTKTMRIAVITTYISTYIFPSILRGLSTLLRITVILCCYRRQTTALPKSVKFFERFPQTPLTV